MGNYQITESIDYSKWDFYDLHMADDVQGADTNLSVTAAQNWLLPYPADAEDPSEALLVKAIEAYLLPAALTTQVFAADLESEFALLYFYHFKPEEIDETKEEFETEIKEAIAQLEFVADFPHHDNTNHAAGGFGRLDIRKRFTFKTPMTFPLNIAMKSYIQNGGAVDMWESPEHWMIKTYYRVIRNPMGELGRILALIRQELSG